MITTVVLVLIKQSVFIKSQTEHRRDKKMRDQNWVLDTGGLALVPMKHTKSLARQTNFFLF